ncbi:MAG TPA: IS701 family transposase [Candidatus Acidoferrales bacterium]|nr:IS701 family transposase [Candidatus Acidoferrales bacterium]
MDEQQLRRLKPELDRFLERYAWLFDVNEMHARRMVQGLLRVGERRNIENIAEALEGGPVRSLQAFITTGAWNDAEILSQMRFDLLEVLADDDAVWNSDETGFPKKGTQSVGVQRQYSGTLGGVDNCQVAVFANYCSTTGHAFMDRRLFLPKEWATAAERRQKAGVPDEVIFRTKPALALEMVAQAVAERIPFRWVGGDAVYGNNPTFVQGVRALGKWYVVDIPCDTLVWTEQPQVIQAKDRPRWQDGRSPAKPLVVGRRRQVDDIMAALPASAWQRIVVSEGSQGPWMYEYAEVPVWFSEDGLPGPAERLLARRTLGQSPQLKYHRAYAPMTVPLTKLAQVRGTRWTIEEDIQSGKGECGLDEYETRGWVGWHHHTALSMLALAFLTLQKQRLGEKRAAADRAGSPRRAEPSARRAYLGHRRNPHLVELAPRAQSSSRAKPSPPAPRRATATAK